MNQMKNRILGLFMLTILGSMLALSGCSAGATSNSSAEFWVRSNCEMCKETIETALNGTEGVAHAELNLDNHMIKVDFDSSKVDVAGLHKACASAGYETKETPHVETAYQDLPKCCKKMEDM